LQQNQQALERKLDAAQSTYKSLLLKLQEAQLEQNKNTSNARIIELAPVPEKPISGAKGKVLALGVMLGLLFSTTTVLFLEVNDKSLKTLKEVRSLFDYPLLGLIPSFRKKPLFPHPDIKLRDSEIPVIDAPHSPVSETYRMIQANLKFLSSDKKLKIIAVTSSVPKEGKSTVSANLAAAIAQLGRQVLLIDADMRHPSQQDIWELTKTEGLSEVLVGQADFWAASCKVTDTLHVLTAGVRPSNPLALLDSKEMASLIKIFLDKYDFVIIDTPPLIGTADTLTLSQMTDGILLVARLGVIDSATARAAKEMLERSGQNVLGLVVNDVSLKNGSTTKI
jgi:capsular exopolysaccharide synthesis family protein